jgi:hypothetical protein
VKEEQDELEDSPRPPHVPFPHRPSSNDRLHESGAPPPSAIQPKPKKRRTTINGVGRLNTDVYAGPSESDTTTPISPVVMGLPTIHPDDHASVDRLRSTLTVKQRQQALIEQRRNSVPGPLPPGALVGHASVHIVKDSFPGPPSRSHGSPVVPVASTSRRPPLGTPTHSSRTSPPSVIVHQPPPLPTTLPAPPGSFASRRGVAGGG